MSNPLPICPAGPASHAWPDAVTLRQMERAREAALARGCVAGVIAEDVRSILLARYPALPLPMIDNAVADVIGEREGSAAPPRPRVVRRFARRAGFANAMRDRP